tara:strand:- start:301 stop:945 length:645 start_codon:yes stop_codon:yes gene_type:complete
MALFTPYHRFGNYQIVGPGDYNQSTIDTALAGVYTGAPDDERVSNNVDNPSNPVRLYDPIVTSNSSADNTNFSSIIPSNATITGVQIRFYYKWLSGNIIYAIDPKIRLDGGSYGSSLGAVAINTAVSSATLYETEVSLGGISLTPSNIDDIELGLQFSKIVGTNPRVAVMGAGFGNGTYEASPAIRIQYTGNSTVSVTNNSKIHITGTSKLSVN